jgi:hypothetical protein
VVPEEEAVPTVLLRAAGELSDGPRVNELVERRDEDPPFGAHDIA